MTSNYLEIRNKNNKQEEIKAYMRGWLKYAQGTYDDAGIDYALKQMIGGLHNESINSRASWPNC